MVFSKCVTVALSVVVILCASAKGDQNVIASHAAAALPDLQNKAEAAFEPVVPTNLTYEEIPLPPSTYNRSGRPSGEPAIAIPAEPYNPVPAPSNAVAGAPSPNNKQIAPAPQPGPGGAVQTPGISPLQVLPSNGSAQSDHNTTSPASRVKPEALCIDNVALQTSTVTRFASECRAYLYTSSDTTVGTCTAWFIDSTHMALAGHCVAVGGSKTYFIRNIGGAYGIVCCSTSTSDDPTTCAADARFYITTAVTTQGWFNNNDGDNDGAVIKVVKYANTGTGFGIPLPYGSISAGPCGNRAIQWGGYPSKSADQAGCNTDFQGKFLYTSESASPSTCPPANSGQTISYPGSACPGLSGGRLIDLKSGLAVGILVRASPSCSTIPGLFLRAPEVSTVDFVQLINNPTTPRGIYLQSMISAIP